MLTDVFLTLLDPTPAVTCLGLAALITVARLLPKGK